ncbi:hypothetical protein L8956_09100 [Peribacillus frigoritolerans]|uniref:hypothetical protein n=1 Tax=Peribacillus frigoritolerans TaxID=450367 RepID=UPI001EFE82A7|nr:hypothetical protein [Peribacillus frigoritolerans]ULM98821.1 hypothetical protein L8956_09100 [Peribacillus frigoritolerans]
MKKEKEKVLTNTIEHVYVPYALVAAITSPVLGWILVKEKGVEFGDLGTFGDFLGGSTVPLLTFITILLLIRTIRIQSNQLDVQKDEFTLLREEMASTKEALQEQGKTAKIQRFENSFFIQINELRNIKSNITKELYEHLVKHATKMVFDSDKLSFKDMMLYLDEQIELRVSANTAVILSQSKMEKDSPNYFHEYGKIYVQAYNHTIRDIEKLEDIISTFHFIIERIVILIFHNKSVMDGWELNYYKDYLYEEITREGFNIVLFHLILQSKEKEKVKELELDDYASPNGNPEFLSKLLNFLLNGSPDWQNKKAKK